MMPADITRLLADGSLGDPPTLPGHPSPETLDHSPEALNHPCKCGACLALRREVFTGASGEQLAAFHDEDGARLVAPFRNAHLPAAEARRLARALLAIAERAEGWMREQARADGPRPLADNPLPCPDGCEHPLTVHSADLGCWLCDCTHGREVAR